MREVSIRKLMQISISNYVCKTKINYRANIVPCFVLSHYFLSKHKLYRKHNSHRGKLKELFRVKFTGSGIILVTCFRHNHLPRRNYCHFYKDNNVKLFRNARTIEVGKILSLFVSIHLSQKRTICEHIFVKALAFFFLPLREIVQVSPKGKVKKKKKERKKKEKGNKDP